MRYVELGRTGLMVSVMALGGGGKSRLGQSQGATRGESVALVGLALDRGVTLLDTAAVYGTEEIIGEAIAGRRSEVVLSSKALIVAAPGLEDLIGGDELTRRVEGSLERLGTEHIDILHLHGVRPEQYNHCIDHLLPALQRLKREGKIGFTGVTENFNTDPTHDMLERATRDGSFDVVMVGFNFVNQTALTSVLPQARAKGIGTLCMFAVRGPLAWPDAANALVHKLIGLGEIDAADVDRNDPLGFLLDTKVAATLTDAAYRFCRDTSGIDVVIAGTGKQKHLLDNLASMEGPPLPDDVLQRLTHIFRNVLTETGEPEP